MSDNEQFLAAVLEQLVETDADDAVLDGVLAACTDTETLDAWAEGTSPARPTGSAITAAPDSRGVFLTALTVEGFRGIGPASTLEFAPGPGLHVVIGRNGCGKSSFAEALEVLLTGKSRRLDERTKAWQSGWRNLHHGEPCQVEAKVHLEGTTHPTVLRRTWAPSATSYGDATTVVQEHGKPKSTMAAIGWDRATGSYRPLLSALDFEDVVGKPSELYERLAGVLGLEAYVSARDRLTVVEKRLKALVDEPTKALGDLLARLAASADERAVTCSTALNTGRKPWDLDAAEVAASGQDAADPSTTRLRDIAALRSPSLEAVSDAVDALRLAAREVDQRQDGALEQAARVSALLGAAIDLHTVVGDMSCPVCKGSTLDAAWHTSATSERDELEARSSALRQAKSALSAAMAAARRFVTPIPSCLDGDLDGFDLQPARSAWEQWIALPAGDSTATASRLGDHLEAAVVDLVDAVPPMVEVAAQRLAQLDSEWRPLAAAVLAWTAKARSSLADKPRLESAKKAGAWLDSEIDRLRKERFEPLARDAQEIWEQLRYRSNVSLVDVVLDGRKTSRRVDVSVSVDDVDAGLGVLSQGEVNAFALSLFIPRATRAESPFRFLVIDDPVQSMDPAKVDGLARVLAELAAKRQVIVLTHDDRLPNSIRRLSLDARVVELARGENSVVEPIDVESPTHRALASARAIAADPSIGADLESRIIPGFCRMALEATFTDLTWRKQLDAGRTHTQIDDDLRDLHSLYERAALALFGDAREGSQVLGRLNRTGPYAGNAFIECNRGAHEPIANARALIDDVEKLSVYLAKNG